MLRQATLDHPPYSPATALTALDAACSVLPTETSGTLVHARLDPADGSPHWTLTWSNAGHPPPLLRTPEGHVTHLVEHDVLLHRALGTFNRTEHRRPLLPGSTLLLYTDGLVERHGHDIDAAVPSRSSSPCLPATGTGHWTKYCTGSATGWRTGARGRRGPLYGPARGAGGWLPG
ncbi:PP2C family protein-serine/threonine phosphatase [Streptomyces lavendulae]|uniref:PP2C family protein-serine/threonine phosphatase n=1 Tax=Streptomyces lavendulae TaxID=1914 RepID=UPI0031E7A21C